MRKVILIGFIGFTCFSLITFASSYRDTDFLLELSKHYKPSLMERLLKDHIRQQSVSIDQVRSKGNLIEDQVTFCDVTLSSLTLLNDYLDQSIPTCSFVTSDKVKHLIRQYEYIVGLFYDEFGSMYITARDIFETPNSLLAMVNPLTTSIRTAEEVQMNALHSITSYKYNIGLFYNAAKRYEAKLANSTIEQLTLVYNEIEKLSLTNLSATATKTPMMKSFRIALQRFNLILEMFSCSKFK